LPLDEGIISQVFDKDKRGRIQSIGARILRTKATASNTARKQLKKAQGGSKYLNAMLII